MDGITDVIVKHLTLIPPTFIDERFINDHLPTLTRLPEHPLQQWIKNNPGASKLSIAASSTDLTRYQVYNWLESAVERGDLVCDSGKYYASFAQ